MIDQLLGYRDEPALFISKEGASKVGLKVLAKLPSHVAYTSVVGPIQKGGETGYNLVVFPTSKALQPRRLTNQALELLH